MKDLNYWREQIKKRDVYSVHSYARKLLNTDDASTALYHTRMAVRQLVKKAKQLDML